MLQALGSGLTTQPIPALVTFQYDAKVPASAQWQAGVQMAPPWVTSIDFSYVGNHGYNRLGNLQGGSTVDLNAVDFGAAYLPQNQDTTRTASDVPGANAFTQNLLRPYRGLGAINQNTTAFSDIYHSLQTSVNRRFRNRFSGRPSTASGSGRGATSWWDALTTPSTSPSRGTSGSVGAASSSCASMRSMPSTPT